MNTQIHRITPDCPPVFPCWLWDSTLPPCWWYCLDKYLWMTVGEPTDTHWHPDAPAAPTQAPFEPAPHGLSIAEAASGRSNGPLPAAVPLSATPRTEAECMRWFRGNDETIVVPADFARTLETELQAATQRIAALEAEWDNPQVLHAHCLRYLTTAQIAHLFGDEYTARVNAQDSRIAAKDAELLTVHQMACRTGLENDQLRAENAELRATVAAWNEMYSNGPTFREINAARAALAQGGGAILTPNQAGTPEEQMP